MSGVAVVLGLLAGLGSPIVLYVVVRSEHDQREEMDREEAERVARRDVDDER